MPHTDALRRNSGMRRSGWPRPAAGPDARSPRISGSACRPCGTGSIAGASMRSTIRPEDRQEDMAAELKRLRRENEILRQERDILKRATAFFAKEGSR